MPPVFTENIFLWAGIAAVITAAGLFLTIQRGRIGWFLGGAGGGLAVLALGAVLVYCVSTDRKEIRRSLTELAGAIELNDLDGVLSHIDSIALETAAKARHHLGLAVIDEARISRLEIKNINRYTSPPTAIVSFNGMVSGREKLFGSQFSLVVKFDEVELIESPNRNWRVTNRCHFTYPGYSGQ